MPVDPRPGLTPSVPGVDPLVSTSLGGVDDLIADLTAATDRSRTTPSHVAVSEALKRRIALGGFSADDRLPTERELAAVLGVGRNTIRRAVRELAEQGVVETTLGRNGGTRIRTGTAAGTADRERITAEFGRAVDRHLEFRSVIEPAAAALAARRATASQRAAVRHALEAPADGLAAYHQADNLLHFAIGRASGNPVLADAIASARAQMFTDTNVLWLRFDWHELYGDQSLPDVLHRDHQPIVAAIDRGDAARAEAEMRAHLEASRVQFERILQRLGTRGATASERPAAGRASATASR